MNASDWPSLTPDPLDRPSATGERATFSVAAEGSRRAAMYASGQKANMKTAQAAFA
jgi:hypothetical protein